MRKTLTIALVWATLSLFSTGCVDVAAPGGNNPANPNSPTDPSNPTNPNDPTNPSNPSNPSTPTDPNDPMYPGETGTYTTHWDSFNTTTSPQKYVGTDYDASNTATVSDTVGGVETAPYKTNFSNNTISYSIVKFPFVEYTETPAADCNFTGTAPDGFVVTDFEYDSASNEITAKEDSTVIDSTGDEGIYTTDLTASYNAPTYKTTQPILRVSYYKSNSGENYYGSYSGNYPYATKWDDGKTTYSKVEFMGIPYDVTRTKEYSTDNEEKAWLVGTAPAGHKESDYVYDDNLKKFKYVGAGASGAATPSETPSDSIGDIIEDAEDVLGDIIENDGAPIML
jgi:hypothetical protein